MKCTEFIDFHAHILPKVDHGCKNTGECITQLKLAKKFNIGTIVSTSHFYPHLHTVNSFVSIRNNAFENMKGYFDEYGIKVIAGAEVQLCIGLDKMPELDKLCIENTDVLLIEIPDMPMSDDMYNTLKRIGRSYNVLIAHADRYSGRVVRTLVDEGYMLQMNAESMVSIRNRKRIKSILDSNLVYAVGSDLHRADKGAVASMAKAKKKFPKEFDEIDSRMRELLRVTV